MTENKCLLYMGKLSQDYNILIILYVQFIMSNTELII